MNLRFRKATPADVPQIVALVNAAYRGDESRKGWTTEAELLDGVRTYAGEISTLIAADGSMILLAVDEDTIVATVHLQRVANEESVAAFLGMFAVQPRGQARGIGKAMMAESEVRVYEEWGAAKMLMDVITVRTELIAFYERRGYRMAGKVSEFPVAKELWTPKAVDLKLARMEKKLPTP
jgi:ribosomal protein S18 acetylase RimI-like enzyme